MIDFLRECNITDSTIDNIIQNNTEQSIFDLSCNEEESKKIIEYMRSIGINNVEDILVNRVDIFMSPFNVFVKKLAKYNIPVVVDLINNDYAVIDNIL